MPRALSLLALLLLISAPAAAQDGIPEPLQPWVPWVTAGADTATCPRVGTTPVCAWPGRLTLTLDEQGGRFELEARADVELDLPLPGDTTRWPRDVRVDGAPAVLVQGARPAVRLAPGSHRITGSFSWARAPESLAVPPGVALVDLTLRGRDVRTPRRDKDGSLWLQAGATEEAEEDRLAIEVHRKVTDGVPVTVSTRLRLRVSGRSREVTLPSPLLAGTEATSLTTSLPVRLGEDGRLVVQLRPGEWDLQVDARSTGPVLALAAPDAGEPWPAEEIWTFEADSTVRSVRIDGPPGVDPARTSLPDAWRALPAWRVGQGTEVGFVELRRGEAQPPPDRLNVDRTLWLGLDGETLSARDRIGGNIFEGGRLELASSGDLGRVQVGGQSQLITVGPGGAEGVEVRDGSLAVDATSTWPRGGALPAVGWDRDARSLSAQLNLPPGWRLVAAGGVDGASGAWLERWTLMDLFLVLLISLAVGKLVGTPGGALMLVFLALSWHEGGAPRASWIALLAVLGLLRVLPEGVFLRAANAIRWLVVIGLATQVVVFSWSASRQALFPQLEQGGRGPFESGWSGGGGMDFSFGDAQMAEPMAVEQEEWDGANLARDEAGGAERSRSYPSSAPMKKGKMVQRAARLDPQAVVQTGPGLPKWTWTSYRLQWNGPVSAGHELRLWLVGPLVNGLLGLLRVAGCVLLLLLLADPRRTRTDRGQGPVALFATPLLALALLPLFGTPSEAQAQLPDQELLNELKTRVLARPACEPNCVQTQELVIQADAAGLRLEAEVHAQATAGWRLPGPDAAWAPARVLLDGAPVAALHRNEQGFLVLRVPEGVHAVTLLGPAKDEVGLQFAEAPRVLSFRGDGWAIAGFRPDAPPPGSVQLSRSQPLESAPGAGGGDEAELAPWLQVRRELDIGVPWLVHNELVRLGGGNRAVLVRVPLLPGESPTTSGIPVENGEAVVSLEPGETSRSWDSTLTEAESLTLTAPADKGWTEVWSLDCSPIFSCAAEGLAPTRHLAEGRWLPRWEPWPGETLTLSLTRPTPAEGATSTLDQARLELTSGRRLMEASLQLSLRSSQGGEHAVTLPPGADLRSFTIDGRDHPAQPDGDRLVFAIEPGAHEVRAEWSQEAAGGLAATAPAVGVGLPPANTLVEWTLPDHRWVLWAWGPRWGPVVTVWQYLLVVLLAAFLLARFAPTPLSFLDWALLGLGLTQIPPALTVVLVLWLVGLSLRGRGRPARWWMHDFAQLALVGATLVALGVLYGAIYQGLVADPDLGVDGAGSYRSTLRWYTDAAGADLPEPGVLWLPIWCWRVAMLLWALWLASRLLKWLRWGWDQLSEGGLWTMPPWWKWGVPAGVRVAPAGAPRGTAGEGPTRPLPPASSASPPPDEEEPPEAVETITE